MQNNGLGRRSKIAPGERIDLHTHSLKSDGRGSPRQVMKEAKDAGLDIIALTDHDTVAGWDEARAAANELGLGFVPGIEVTTRSGETDSQGVTRRFTTHLLAYFPDPNEPNLKAALDDSVTSRVSRLKTITDRLSEDFDLTWEHVSEVLSDGKVAGRPAIADAMIRRGLLETRDPFFDLVRPGTKYYEPNRGVPNTIEAIELIRGAGGVPVIAHPMARGNGPQPGEPMPRAGFEAMIAAGLAGFEAHHRDVAPHVSEWLQQLAFEHDLFVTGSSDYHGTGKQNRLGEHLTDVSVLQKIMDQAGVAEL
jgi:predicted metal-dependent phosphoesterase TrpH